MSLKRRFYHRLVGVATYWGLIKHPFGRDYAKESYTATGKKVQD